MPSCSKALFSIKMRLVRQTTLRTLLYFRVKASSGANTGLSSLLLAPGMGQFYGYSWYTHRPLKFHCCRLMSVVHPKCGEKSIFLHTNKKNSYDWLLLKLALAPPAYSAFPKLTNIVQSFVSPQRTPLWVLSSPQLHWFGSGPGELIFFSIYTNTIQHEHVWLQVNPEKS